MRNSYAFSEDAVLDVEPARAFALVSDYTLDPRWRRGVLEMRPSTRGPASPGTTTEEVVRFLGQTFVNPGRVVAVDERALRLDWEAEGEKVRARGARCVTAAGTGRSRLTYSVEVELKGAPALVTRLTGRILRRTVRRDLRRLRALAGDLVAS